MGNYMQHFLFVDYAYIAAAVFVVGNIVRFNYGQYGWKSSSSQLLSGRGMPTGSNLFHVGIILLFFGHLLGLLTPESLYTKVISIQHKQILAMTAGGIFGGLCFIGLTFLICRRLFNPRVRATSSFADIFILLLLYAQLILGLTSIYFSSQHVSGAEMVALANWAQHLVTFRAGASTFLIHANLIFKLHIVLGLTIFLVFPFTRLVHILSMPIWYLFRQGYQIVRRAEG